MTQNMSGYVNSTIHAVPAVQPRLIGYLLLEIGCDPLNLMEYIRTMGHIGLLSCQENWV